MVMLALAPLGSPAGADADFVIGSGRARASLFEIVPRTGGLEIPVNFGKALTTYQGLSATATSGGVKPPAQNSADGDCGGGFKPPGGGGGNPPGPPGGNLPAPPSPGGGKGPSTSFPWVSTLTVSTGDQDAAKGKSIDQGSFPDGSPITGTFERQEVQATDAPAARAVTTSGHLAFGPVAEIVQGRTEASTGVIEQKARESHAVTTMDRLSLLGGMIVLNDVRWEATQRTGEGAKADGTFTVGSILLNGQPLPAPPTAPPAALPGGGSAPLPDPLTALNTALSPTGIALVAPHFDSSGGVASVGPMSLRFADSALGRVVLGPIVGALQPLRDPVVGGLLAASCDFGTAVTVADVATAILTGAGGLSFDFGGVTATTEGEHYDNPLLGGGDDGAGAPGGDLGALPDAGPEPAPAAAFGNPATDVALPASPADNGGSGGADYGSPSAGTGGGSVGSASGGGPAVGSPSAGDEGAFGVPAFGSATHRLPGHKGGRAVAVAALALLAVVVLAAADAFHLRRASRSIS